MRQQIQIAPKIAREHGTHFRLTRRPFFLDSQHSYQKKSRQKRHGAFCCPTPKGEAVPVPLGALGGHEVPCPLEKREINASCGICTPNEPRGEDTFPNQEGKSQENRMSLEPPQGATFQPRSLRIHFRCNSAHLDAANPAAWPT